jgi:hypothetical protein
MHSILFAVSGGNKTTDTFAQKATDAARLMDYLESKGLRPNQTRLGEYSRFYRKYLSGKCSNTEIEEKLIFVMREMDEWSWIYRGLMQCEPAGSFDLLKQAMGGVAFAKGEAEDTRPRNIQLELRIASYFLQAGFAVSFSGLADLVVDVDGFPVFIECKRLNSPKQVIKRGKEAARQLKHRYQTFHKSSYGLVVLDAGRTIHPKQGVVSGPTEAIIREGLQAQLNTFERDYDIFESFATDKRLISVWIQAMAPGFHLADKTELCTLFSSVYSIYGRQGQRRRYLFERMRTAFEAA